MNRTVITLFFSLICCTGVIAQNTTPQEYIEQFKDLAIEEMKRSGIPAAITLAQGLLESQSGNSDLVKASNNHFGIKCKSNWTAETVSHDDDAPGECFRKYKSADDSYRDHSDFLKNGSRYAFLFSLDPTDYKGWAYGLKKAGYATNPQYPQMLIKSIENYNLEQYTQMGLGQGPTFESSIARQRQIENISPIISSAAEPAAPANITINGLKALYVPAGTSLLAVATEQKINLSRLLGFNDLDKDGILEKGQYLFLEKKLKEGNRDFCIAEPGERLYDIAQKNGVLLENICLYNQLNAGDAINGGAKIYLRPHNEVAHLIGPSLPPSMAGDVKEVKAVTHNVAARESLYSISKKYGVTVDELKTWNHLTGNHLQVGQQLIVSK